MDEEEPHMDAFCSYFLIPDKRVVAPKKCLGWNSNGGKTGMMRQRNQSEEGT
jgi:hypothetical protein